MDLLYSGSHPLYLLGVIPSAELIPAVIEAYKAKSKGAESLAFRPLHIETIYHHSLNLHAVWPAVAERHIRPCTHCLAQNNYFGQYGTDRYHFVNGTVGRLTVEVSHWLGYRNSHWTENRWIYGRNLGIKAIRIYVEHFAVCWRSPPNGPARELAFLKQNELLAEVLQFVVRDDLDIVQLTCRRLRDIVDGRSDTLPLRPFAEVFIDSKMFGCNTANSGVVPYANVTRVRQGLEAKLAEKADKIATLKEALAQKEAQSAKEKDELKAKITELENALAERKSGEDTEDFGFEHLTVEDTVF